MKKTTLPAIVLATLLVIMAGCATMQSAGHKYVMRGQILEASDSTAYLCIGSSDGAQVGQELTVYRFVRMPNSSPKSLPPHFKREETGKVKIVEIVDEHYAKADVLQGEAKVNYMVELGQ